jgi:hypothetical protein
MKVENEYNDKKGEFYILENSKKIAMLEYVFAGPNKFIIDHTEVAINQEGKGLGKILVKAAVDFAKKLNTKYCLYVLMLKMFLIKLLIIPRYCFKLLSEVYV